MSGEEKPAGLEHQDPEVGVGSVPVHLLGKIATEHAGTDDHGVEGKAAVLDLGFHLRPVIADIPTEKVMGKRRLLDLDTIGGNRGGQKLGQVRRVLGHDQISEPGTG